MNLKVRVVSDLHLEYSYKSRNESLLANIPNENTVLVIAGDLCEVTDIQFTNIIEYLVNRFPYIVYVSGNHEHYYSSFEQVEEVRNIFISKYSNLYWLNNESVQINNLVFHGTTLWFRETPRTIINFTRLNDFTYIKDFHSLVYKKNQESLSFISNLEINRELVNILVTHHVPSYQCLHEKYKKLYADTNDFYYCDIEEYLSKFDYALAGHTHYNHQSEINGCSVHINPKGHNLENKKFNWNYLVYPNL